MPEFEYYCLQAECRELLRVVLQEHSLRYVVDQWYPIDYCPTYSYVDDATGDMGTDIARVYLLGDFTQNGVVLRRQEGGERAGFYTVNGSTLGPLISIDFPKNFEEMGLHRIASGRIHHPVAYCADDTGMKLKANAALQLAYRAIRQTVQRYLAMVDLTESVWVSESALSLVRKCEGALLVNGSWVCGTAGKLTVTKRVI